MKIKFMGKYNGDPESLPKSEHKPNAVMFKEAKNSGEMAKIATIISVIVLIFFAAIAIIRFLTSGASFSNMQLIFGLFVPNLLLFPHEILHAICLKEEAYIYTNMREGMLFVVGTEDMSKFRFVFMSLFPNIVFGLVPFVLGFINPEWVFFLALGASSLSMGAGDYYNVYNALTQMPKGSRTYLHGFNSYWYMP